LTLCLRFGSVFSTFSSCCRLFLVRVAPIVCTREIVRREEVPPAV